MAVKQRTGKKYLLNLFINCFDPFQTATSSWIRLLEQYMSGGLQNARIRMTGGGKLEISASFALKGVAYWRLFPARKEAAGYGYARARLAQTSQRGEGMNEGLVVEG
jgi:hypothetical protein